MNCLDCLDRTNAVQSFIALEVCLSGHLYPVLGRWGMGWVQHLGWALVVTVGRGQPCARHLERGIPEASGGWGRDGPSHTLRKAPSDTVGSQVPPGGKIGCSDCCGPSRGTKAYKAA